MSKITSKYQVSIPRALVDKLGLKVGDDLAWEEAAGALRAQVAQSRTQRLSVAERLRLFDAASRRLSKRETARKLPARRDRGWTRADLYTR